jgi:hypothetical protein
MAPVTRLSLAEQAYLAALRAARAQSTPRTWARLLRAARNLRDASAPGDASPSQGVRPRD